MSYGDSTLSKRRSIEVPGVKHDNPIPAACRIGPFVATGSIFGKDPATGKLVDGTEQQCEVMFGNIRRLIEAAGGSTDDILKLNFWVREKSFRAIVNKQWLLMFPDEHSRPARHTFVDPELAEKVEMQCEFTAVIGV